MTKTQIFQMAETTRESYLAIPELKTSKYTIVGMFALASFAVALLAFFVKVNI